MSSESERYWRRAVRTDGLIGESWGIERMCKRFGFDTREVRRIRLILEKYSEEYTDLAQALSDEDIRASLENSKGYLTDKEKLELGKLSYELERDEFKMEQKLKEMGFVRENEIDEILNEPEVFLGRILHNVADRCYERARGQDEIP